MNNIDSNVGLSDPNNKDITKDAVNRFTRIDSIRGLAALAVAVFLGSFSYIY